MSNSVHTIDATGRSLGRIASEAAVLLMGKNSPDFEKHKVSKNKVNITNASKTKITGNKRTEVKYKQYSGYPGGLKETPMEKVIEKKGYTELFRHAVRGMLPDNKLRKLMMKNLSITE